MTKLEALENEVKSAALAVEFAIDLAVATNAVNFPYWSHVHSDEQNAAMIALCEARERLANAEKNLSAQRCTEYMNQREAELYTYATSGR